MAIATKTKKKTKKAAKKATAKVTKKAAKKPAAKAGKKAPASKATAPKAKAKPKIKEPDRSTPTLAEVDADVLEFIAAIDTFKKKHARPFPSWSEVLLIVRELGYRR